jgi:nucleoside-diphosphate-sugar epimerase
MIVGLTGSTGVLGSELISKSKNINFRYFDGDIRNFDHVKNWINNNDLDSIIHLAAVVPIRKVNSNKKKAYDVNFLGTKNLVDSIKLKNVKKIWFFLASTSHVYSKSNKTLSETSKIKPKNYYAFTKLQSEKYLINNKKYINYCIGRIFSYTSYLQKKDYFIPNIISKLRNKNKILEIKGTNHYRDFLPIEDVIKAIQILNRTKPKGIFNICSSQKILLSDIIKFLNFKDKRIKFINDHTSTSLVGSNRKLKKLSWRPSYKNYLNYIKKYEKNYNF